MTMARFTKRMLRMSSKDLEKVTIAKVVPYAGGHVVCFSVEYAYRPNEYEPRVAYFAKGAKRPSWNFTAE